MASILKVEFNARLLKQSISSHQYKDLYMKSYHNFSIEFFILFNLGNILVFTKSPNYKVSY